MNLLCETVLAGGMVFSGTAHPVALNDYSQWWRFTPGVPACRTSVFVLWQMPASDGCLGLIFIGRIQVRSATSKRLAQEYMGCPQFLWYTHMSAMAPDAQGLV